MTTTPEYDKLVEAKMHKVTQMSHQETAQEVAKTTEGVFETKAGAVFDYSISPDGKTVTIKGTDRGVVKSLGNGDVIDNIPEDIQPKKKRGRPKGSKNKPKTTP